jgi:excisionase family DNA binding protein
VPTPNDGLTLRPAKKAAERRGLPYTTLRDIVLRGEIPVVKVGRAWYLEDRDVDRWVERRKETYA